MGGGVLCDGQASTHRVKARCTGRSLLIATLALNAILAWPQPVKPLAAAQSRPRVALVLSGGAALGIAHLGVIEKIEEAGIPIDMVLGTSMGAIVGGLYAAGYSPRRMEELVGAIDWNEVLTERRDTPGDRYYHMLEGRYPVRAGFDRRGFNTSPGLLRGQNVLSLFTALVLHDLNVRDFDDLPVRYRAVAADILTGDKVVMSSGSLAEAMRASMSIPGVFRPYEIGGRNLVDGGIVDNMPVGLARELGADIVIAVESRPHLATSPAELRSAIAITTQTLDLFVEENMRVSRKLADLLIVPDLRRFGRASFADTAELIEAGRRAGEEAMPELRALAARISESRHLVQPEEQANRSGYRPVPIIDSLSIEGGGAADQELARAAIRPFVGLSPDRDKVKTVLDALFATGRFASVKLDLLPVAGSEGQRATAVLSLVPEMGPSDALLLGGDFRAVLSSLSGNETYLSSALLLRGLSGTDSALLVDAVFIGRTEAYAEYFQPFGSFSIKPFGRYRSQYDSYTVGESFDISPYYRTAGGGMWMGFTFSRHADLRGLWSYDAIKDKDGGAELAALGIEARIDTRRTPLFSEQGFYLDTLGRWADPAFGGGVSFVTVECEVGGDLPLSPSSSLGIGFYFGTDFRGLLPVPGGLPPDQYFSLRRPGMFYGLEPRPEEGRGEHAAALSLELRRRLGDLNNLLGGDLFIFANLSAGVTKIEGDPSIVLLPPRLDGTLGLGARITSSFGALVGLGCISDGNPASPIRAALTLELGTFAAILEDRR